MAEIRLDFSHYSTNNQMFFEVESDTRLRPPFGHGYATTDLYNFLDYLAALRLNQAEALPFLNDASWQYRFESHFPEREKNLILAIMGVNCEKSDDLTQRVLGYIRPESVLLDEKTEDQRKKLGKFEEIYFLNQD